MRIAIIGAGMAGLRAAMLLEAQGFETVIYESRDRIGGRSYTIRGDGLAFDAGGEWIDSDHFRALELIRTFGLRLLPSSSTPRDVHYGGEWRTTDDLWDDVVEDEIRFEAAAREMCRDLQQVPWANTDQPDVASLSDFLNEQALSARGHWWLKAQLLSDEGDEPYRIGLLGWLCGYQNYLDRNEGTMSAYRVDGGMGRLTDAMASHLKGPIHLGEAVERVSQVGHRVQIFTETTADWADALIITSPPPALEKIVFDPALQPKKRCAIEACQMSRIVKFSWEYETPWWREYPSGGSFHVEGPLQQLWDGSQDERFVLNAYVCGDDADYWIKQENPAGEATQALGELFPEARGGLKNVWLHDWINDPFVGGGFSNLAPGYVLGHMRHIGSASGRIFFAGEHTALWTGFFEGALESAERAVKELKQCVG